MSGPLRMDERLDAWQDWQTEPWGRIRYAVVAHTLQRVCARLTADLTAEAGRPRPLRLLDVGGADGADALPLAAAGHDVTVLDPSEPLLARATLRATELGVPERLRTLCGGVDDLADPALGVGTGFDLVLLHNVLQYRPDTAATLTALARVVAPRGAVSVLAPNPAAEVLGAVVRRHDLAEATRLLTARTIRSVTLDEPMRRVAAEEAEQALAALDLPVAQRFGVRAVTDLITDDARKHDPDYYAELERLELALCDREPYLRTARFWQLIARRG